MNKTPITVALERQIPEYIRGEYDLFVKFIKAYYEFLDQTQQRDLENIHSISNTLDEFIIRFKKELSVLFPTNSLVNERFILERIREFYQARGSKESYQFLFKTIFNKNADIFYPSTQILRASDGKWIQEKSVFVSSSSGNIFNYSGKIIEINTKQKTINVFCPRVVYYRENIYEVFIERAYTQDINIGDTLSSSDGIDTGFILPCPSKYTITSEGSGFEIGNLYNLKTESGDGSLVKITKIGSAGSIKKIQIISFGLDYESTFYANLSNKTSVAFAYRRPISSMITGSNTYAGNQTYGVLTTMTGIVTAGSTIVTLYGGNTSLISKTGNPVIKTGGTGVLDASVSVSTATAGNNEIFSAASIAELFPVIIYPVFNSSKLSANQILLSKAALTSGSITFKVLVIDSAYQDGNNGFVDYGYINKQDYFYYDKFYTPSIDNAETVFYADGTYVGDIIGSFYTNASNTNVIDNTIAEIKVELGSVAIYPGYYETSDGFVSDASYIQDGKYYQLFSYVIKVEQQLNSYYDIVKELLHPAGLELYAQYDIKNNYLVSASPLLAFIRRQFLEQEYVTDDEGTNEVYKITDDSQLTLHNFLEDIKDVTKSVVENQSTIHNILEDIKDVFKGSAVTPIENAIATSVGGDWFWNGSAYVLNSVEYKNTTSLSIQKYYSNGILVNETDERRWSVSTPVGGNWSWNGSAYVLNDVEYKIIFNQKNAETVTIDSESSTRYWDISSSINGTFYQTTTVVGGDWLWNGSAYVLNSVEYKNTTLLSIQKYTPDGVLTTESDTRRLSYVDNIDTFAKTVSYIRSNSESVTIDSESSTRYWDISSAVNGTFYQTSSAVGGDWLWNGSAYILNNPEIRIGVGYIRTPTLLGFQATLVSGSTTVTLTSGVTDGFYGGLLVSKVSGVGAFGVDTRILAITNSTSFTVTVANATSGAISFSITGDTTQLGETLSAPTDTFPDGSTQGLVKFSLSGASWADTQTPNDVFNRTVVFDRSIIPLVSLDPAIPEDSFPDGSTQGLVKFSLSGGSWTDALSSPTDAINGFTFVRNPLASDTINNSNTGLLYYNVYNQNDALDPTTSYSYEAEIYSVHDTRVIS